MDAIDQALAAQAARKAAREAEVKLAQAKRLRERAEEWPRCGQRWPMTAAERAADTLLRAAGDRA